MPPARRRPQYVDWGEKLAAQGIAVLFPDSYGSRGLGSQCRVRNRSVRPFRERVADAQAARDWLQTQDWVQKDRVSLLGWSNGAIATLWAVRPRAAPKDEPSGFPLGGGAVSGLPTPRRDADGARASRR